MKISLILPSRNEGENVRPTLESILAQTRQPDEIVVGDGCSTDDTVARIRSYEKSGIPVRVEEEHERSIGAGRNVAIDAAEHEIIACADFGTVLDPRWLEELVRPLESDPRVDMVAGTSLPAESEDLFERCVVAVTHHSVANREARLAMRIPEVIIPCTNSVAFRKSVWEAAGGFPEWIKTSEDKLFGRKVHLLGGKVVGTLDAVVYYDMRTTLGSLYRQFYAYGRGNAQSRQTSGGVMRLAAKYALAAVLAVAGTWHPLAWALLALGGARHLYVAGLRLYLSVHPGLPDPRVLLYVPAILLVRDLAQIAGHAAGYVAWFSNPIYRRKYSAYMTPKRTSAG